MMYEWVFDGCKVFLVGIRAEISRESLIINIPRGFLKQAFWYFAV